MLSHPVRALLATSLVGALVLAGGALQAASADTPQGWEVAPAVSPLGFLLVLLIIPVGLAMVIALLTVLPGLTSDKGYEPGQSWRGERTWFGGPTAGLSAADDLTPQQLGAASSGAGGSSGRW